MYRDDIIRARMAAMRITRLAVAKKARLSSPTVSNICNGNPNVKIKSLKGVADVVGISLKDLFTFDEPASTESTPQAA